MRILLLGLGVAEADEDSLRYMYLSQLRSLWDDFSVRKKKEFSSFSGFVHDSMQNMYPVTLYSDNETPVAEIYAYPISETDTAEDGILYLSNDSYAITWSMLNGMSYVYYISDIDHKKIVEYTNGEKFELDIASVLTEEEIKHLEESHERG